MKFNQYFREWLLGHGMTQKNAADYLGTGQAQISKICNGGKISMSTVKKLAVFMNMDELEVAKRVLEAGML